MATAPAPLRLAPCRPRPLHNGAAPCIPVPCMRIGGGWSTLRSLRSASIRASGAKRSSRHAQQLSVRSQAFGGFGKGKSSGDDVGRFASDRRGAIKLPAIVLEVTVEDVLNGDVVSLVSELIAAGATIVLVSDPSGGGGGGELYTAACALKVAIRGRATLLVSDRADIADAAEADGVCLSFDGVPTVVARRMMQKPGALVARECATAGEAATASKEGASLVLIKGESGKEVVEAVAELRPGATIPLVAAAPEGCDARDLVAAGADGLSLTPAMVGAAAAAAGGEGGGPREELAALLAAFGAAAPDALASSDAADTGAADAAAGAARKVQLDAFWEEVMNEEKGLVGEVLGLVKSASPEMAEITLLEDALKQLDDLFLMVVVGEFNSGKSSVINALLGARYLKEGILPTTNEISVLKHTDNSPDGKEGTVRGKDGLFVRYLPADLLTEVSVVDTPGTNVILDRQQQLTEEYVPRSDLVLFIISADRPFSESEVTFLQYIRRWGKKVVFVINKIDMLSNPDEVAELSAFVEDNAKRLLNVDTAPVIPVSARKAQAAKDAGESLAESGFGGLEEFVFTFLGGGEGSGAERMRLKLDTPLAVSQALLEACRRQLDDEMEAADAEVRAVTAVELQLDQYRDAMEKDAKLQRQRAAGVINKAIERGEQWVDETLSLSNVQSLSGYLNGSGESSLPVASTFKQQIVGSAREELNALLGEHTAWLTGNNDVQRTNYLAFVEARKAALEQSPMERETADASSVATEVVEEEEGAGSDLATVTEAMVVASRFDVEAAARVLEEEIREATVSTAGAAAGALALGVLLSAILPNTAEDLLGWAIALLAGYVGVLNVPLRRAEAKAKMRRVAEKYSKEVEGAMREELEGGLEGALSAIRESVQPLQVAAEAEVERVRFMEERRAGLDGRVGELKNRVANIE